MKEVAVLGRTRLETHYDATDPEWTADVVDTRN